MMQFRSNGMRSAAQPVAGVRPTPEAVYEERCARFAAVRDDYERRWSRIANWRLLLFVGAAAFGLLGLWQTMPALYGVAIALAVAFIAAVAYHYRLGLTRRRYAELWAINDEGLRRLRRDWAALPLRAPAAAGPLPPVAVDLDLLGHASLQHLLNTPVTDVGLATLQHWLLTPAAPDVIRRRQSAVTELTPLIDWRDELALRGRLLGGAQHDYAAFLHWAEGTNWISDRPALLWFSRIIAVVTPIVAVASFVSVAFAPFALALIAVTAFITWRIGGRIANDIQQVATRQEAFRTYAALFELIGAHTWSAPALREIQASLNADGRRADAQMHRLSRITALADLRLSFLYLPLQLLTLFDIHTLWLLERWRRAAGSHVRAWLDGCGELEALAALGTLSHDNPTWSFPQLVEGRAPLLSASHLGHPLLPDSARVVNDVEVGPSGTLLLVTGSNMSGKSTLLRAVGINVVLAQAGGPVCAAVLRLPPLVLGTSMRVQDSLEQGVSYFMAELRRLKEVVDLAHSTSAADGTLLYLLDEILHGTNTGERQIAARRILHHLVNLGAIGMVSTHDLALADAPELASAIHAVHFTESFTRGPDGPSMSFDYKLRPGVATSTNALKWLEIVGLGEDLDVAAASQNPQGVEIPLVGTRHDNH